MRDKIFNSCNLHNVEMNDSHCIAAGSESFQVGYAASELRHTHTHKLIAFIIIIISSQSLVSSSPDYQIYFYSFYWFNVLFHPSILVLEVAPAVGGERGEGASINRYTVTTRMISALRWTAM